MSGKRSGKSRRDRRRNAVKKKEKPSNLELALQKLRGSALNGLLHAVTIHREDRYPMKKTDRAYVTSSGHIYLNPFEDYTPNEWVYIIAHCLLHLGLDHIREDRAEDHLWQTACDLAAARFLQGNRIGTPPFGADRPIPVPTKSEEDTYELLASQGDHRECLGFGMMTACPDMIWDGPRDKRTYSSGWGAASTPVPYPQVFAESLQEAMEESLWEASVKLDPERTDTRGEFSAGTLWRKAREWFLSSFPLLGAVASSFRIIDQIRGASPRIHSWGLAAIFI